MHQVTFNPQNDLQAVFNNADFTETTFTVFFKLNSLNNAEGALECNLLYHDPLNHFVFEKVNKRNNKPVQWKTRQRQFAIGRMNYVPPTGHESFYIRKLLTVVWGPTSFGNLQTVNGFLFPTFHDACLARGIFTDDREWHKCLEKADQLQMVGSCINYSLPFFHFARP